MSKRMLMLVAAITALAVLAIPLYQWVKGRKSNQEEINTAFSGYISGYTSGVISNRSTIKIILANEHVTPAEVGKDAGDLFSFSPSIAGKAVWLDTRTIEFRPDAPLPSGQEYEAEFDLSKVAEEVPSELSTFSFRFMIIRQNIEVTVDKLTTTDRKNMRWQRINGTLATADATEEKEVPGLLTATQNSKSLPVRWEHDPDRTTHHFTIDSISRKEKADSIYVEWSGAGLGAPEVKSSFWIPVAALGDFKVMDVKVIQEPEQYVSVQFSDPLQEKQNLDGLITLADNPSIKFVIEDNEVRAYPSARQDGPKLLTVETGVKNLTGYPLKEKYTMEVVFEQLKPEVRLVGKGVILPNSEGLYFPFEAVNLSAVDVKVIKIFENNIPQFLQVNSLEGERELKRVGKQVLNKKIPLTVKSSLDRGKWNTYSLDLASLVKTEPGAIYKIILSFKQEYSTYRCDASTVTSDQSSEVTSAGNEENSDEDDNDWEYYGDEYYDDYYDEGYDYYDYDYNERDNPCSPSYYNRSRQVSRNVLASDLGLLVKRGTDGSMMIAVNDLRTTKPLPGTIIEAYDYQQQLLASAKTNGDGFASFNLKKKPFLVVAKKDKQRGYLKMDDGSSLSLSMFDVSGEEVQKGIKGFIYGERGVWRPGDTLFLSFILEDKQNTLPKNHPVTFELTNPRGQLVKKIVRTSGLDGFYDFTTSTDPSAPTGNWTARVKVGGASFTKNIKVETIMPNRLKIKLDFPAERLSVDKKDMNGQLQVAWLHGAPARNLKAKVEVVLNQASTSFKKYEDYQFDDPSRSFSSESQVLFDGQLDDKGMATVKPNINVGDAAPGMLKAYFTVRAFEEGGGFSIDRFSKSYSPYASYVGVQLPKGDKYTGMLVTDTNHIVKVVTVDPDGKPLSRKLKVQVYKVQWRWWWDSYEGDLANYVGDTYKQAYYTQEITTVNGKGQFVLRVNRPEWGRFFVHVTDEESGHATGETVYIDWPSGAGSSPKGNEGATMLSFTADKPKYNVGETAKLSIPSGDGGRALVSLESGSKVIKTYWVETTKGETNYSFPVTADMAPNVYVHVTLIQPHAQTKNDLPIRLYGVIPLQVEDPTTHLYPELKCAPVWRPEEKASVTVSEKNGKDMTYTLAIVDEGLLDLTRFQTPDPWNTFYAREALGVKTWDIYDMVMGAYGAQLQRILAIGGDAEYDSKGAKKANRFKPMVKFMGPFHLGKGDSKTHTFMMPQYVGSVRVMIVTGQDAAYGNAEKTVAVRKPLMILGTLPRVVGPGETVDLPVTVFAMEKQVKNVSVEIAPNNMFIAEEGTKKSVSFNEVGDQVVNFKLKVKSLLGIGKVKIVATSGSEKATYDIELDVRNPNPKVVDVVEAVIEPGKTWSQKYALPGMAGTNAGTLELSNIPPINLGARLKYLIQYPHGCVEQTTSSVFPQLFLSDIMELDASFKLAIDKNVRAGIDRLRSFQTSSGGFSYWPGYSDADDWGSSYAGHFMLMAEKKGYTLPSNLLDSWKRYQKGKAAAWTPRERNGYYYYYNDDLDQAYRLYTLALAKSPELGAMNRLKEYKELSNTAKWRLAAAYVLAGQPEVAKKLVYGLPTTVKDYRELSYTYGSDERDIAMILETLTLLGDRTKAAPVVKEVSNALSKGSWMSTQTTAYCLIAVAEFASNGKAASTEMRYTYSINGKSASLNTKMPVKQIDMQVKGAGSGTVEVKNNNTSGILFARIILEGIPETGDQTDKESDLKMNVAYTKMDGSSIDPARLEQGTDFIAVVTVSNPGIRGDYQQMALSQIFPSGWEIHNTRMDETETTVKSDYPTYQDFRDDRVYTYFDIAPGKSKTFRIILNAAYTGKFYLPTVYCEAMYDNTINARKPGKWVEIVKPGTVQ
jgi:uncharacterized protein YfaS (alpha-2-macroglobulin family)